MEQSGSTRNSSGSLRRPFLGGWWDPRRSLGARLVWTLVPLALLPALFDRISSNRLWEQTQKEVTTRLTVDAARRERLALRQAADRRVRELNSRAAEVLLVVNEAAAEVAAALAAGPSSELPAETLVEESGGPIRTTEHGDSAAMITRSIGVTPATRRDLAATRRLEKSFASLAAGHPAISATFAITLSGVLRAVPWCDLSRLVEAGAFDPNFRIPGRFGGTLEKGSPPIWTPVYEDLYAHRGRIVSAIVPVHDQRGELVGEVGTDWVVNALFARIPEALRPGETEIIFSRDGKRVFEAPEPAVASTDDEKERAALFAKASGQSDVALRFRGEETIGASGRVNDAGWTYVRLLPVAALERSVRAQIEPVFSATRGSRTRIERSYLAGLLLLGLALILAANRATAPIRRVALSADAITQGDSAPELPGRERQDEVGRLARALANLDLRIRRRMRLMEGLHDIARTGSVMTRPDETYARLSRRIAELVGATKSWFAIWDPDSRSLVFAPPGYGMPDETLAGVRIGMGDQSLALLAFRTGETYVSNDLLTDPRISRNLARIVDVKRNAVFAPLRTEAGTLGVMIVCDKPAPFDDEDNAAIQIYADEAALLLRNARLYEELQKSYERLREAHRNRDYFLQNINHELRTPLTAILGWSEVLAEDRPNAETVETAIEQIRRSAQFLLTLISDLLDLSRFEEGRTQLDREKTDLGTLVRESVEPVAVMAEAKGIALAVIAPASGEVAVLVDPIRMKQVLWNLVHNAVKFTSKGGRIEISAEGREGSACFTVADDGVGVDPKDLPYIFERFRQGDGSTTRSYRGTGIGLALAKAYVELHGGSIGVESGPGRGAHFTVRLPGAVVSSAASPTT
ncbi:MAG: ATP-binding protein [Thermoanaerobaculia bacterium]